MRLIVALAVMALSTFSTGAFAYEHYITSGHSYTPQNIPLPPIDSPQAGFTQQTDTLEAEIYVKERQRQIQNSQIRRFLDGNNPGIPSDEIDY